MSQGMRDLLDRAAASTAEQILLAASRPSCSLSWLLLVPPAGEVIAIQSLSDEALRLLHVGEAGALRAMARRSPGRMPQPPAAPPTAPATAPDPRRELAGDGARVRQPRSGSMSSGRPTARAGRWPSPARPDRACWWR